MRPLTRGDKNFARNADAEMGFCRGPPKTTPHVLDTAHGCPAQGIEVELWSIAGQERKLLKTVRTNADGRTDQPLLAANAMQVGEYELIFHVGDYFAGKIASDSKVRFLDRVPV